jgi:hypothetical protein
MQCACPILSSVACPALRYFSILSHKRSDLKKSLLNITCVFGFPLQLQAEIFLILRRNERYIMNTVGCIGFHVKYLLFLSDVNETEFLHRFSKKYSNINFRENPFSGSRVVACVRTDGHDEVNLLAPEF